MNKSMIDKAIVERVRNADIINFLEKYHGFTFAHRSSEFRCQQHKSLAVKSDRLSWFWHSKGIGGFGILDYLTKVENMPFREAVTVAIGTMAITDTPISAPTQLRDKLSRSEEPPKKLILPDKTGVPIKLYDYLCRKRGIDGDIVNTLMQKEMLYEDRRGNVVFVGYDEQQKPRFASLRGTHGDCSFRGDCSGSDKRYGFSVAASVPSERLYIFESPIDLMSHASLKNTITGDKNAWKQHNHLSLAGTTDTAMSFFLNQHKAVKELIFCLDNDEAGRKATVSISKKYAEKGYISLIELPRGKDWNEDLQAYRTHEKAKKHTLNRTERSTSI